MGSKGKYTVLKHTIIGAIIFYFLIHPLTMVIYWFEFNNDTFNWGQFLKVVTNRFGDSFSFRMMKMSSIFIVIGAVVGLVSGLYYKKILQKNKVLKQQEEQLERNIEYIIDKGENEKVEFKSSLRYDYVQKKLNKALEKVFLKTIAGFLNAQGGTLLIGVDDDRNLLGLEKDYATLKKKDRDGFELKLIQLIATHIGTEFCSLLRISFYSLNEKDICSIHVNPAKTPVYVSINNKTLFYLRTGNATNQLTIQEAVNYINLNK